MKEKEKISIDEVIMPIVNYQDYISNIIPLYDLFVQQEALDSLCELYSLLKEEDMFAGLWQKRAKFADTNIALAYEQHGFFEQAQNAYEQVCLQEVCL